MITTRILPAVLLCASAFIVSSCAPKAPETSSSVQAQKVFDQTLTNTEKEFVSLVGAMPEDKFGFAPTAGKFDGVRTFGQQAKHAAFVLNELSAVLLGESTPPTGAHENGPDELTGKDQILQYVKDAFAHAHRGVATITNDNLLEQTVDPFNAKGKRARVDTVGVMSSHTFDHYGQMVVYARMNGIVPPASQ
jgi:uncharacterized damage-inducible protein DinB